VTGVTPSQIQHGMNLDVPHTGDNSADAKINPSNEVPHLRMKTPEDYRTCGNDLVNMPEHACGVTTSGSAGDPLVTASLPRVVTPENPSSTPLSSSLVTTVTTSLTSKRDKKEEDDHGIEDDHGHVKYIEEGEVFEKGSHKITRASADLAKQPCDPLEIQPVDLPRWSQGGKPQVAPTAPDPVKSIKRVKLTPEQREVNKIAKAAAAAAAKAELRAAAVALAAGETVPLPAVVLRGERPRSVTMIEAAEIVRTATERAGGKCDIESSGYPIGHPLHKVRTVQLGDLMAVVVFDATDPAQIALAGELIAQAPRLGAFSATADLAPLAHLGAIDHEAAWAKMEDAVIPAKLADPAGAGSDAADGLKALSALTLGPLAVAPAAEAAKDELAKAAGWTFSPKPGETTHERNGWAMVASDCATMVTYAASDVLDTAAVVVRLPDPGPVLLGRERALQRLVARVTFTGVRIDGELSARLLDEHQSASNIAAAAVRSFGIDNPGSTQQVAARLTSMGLVLPRTAPSKSYPQGQLSAKQEVLMGLRAEGLDGDAAELVNQLIEFGSHKNAISTFLGPYVAICRDGDGRARPTVYTMEAKTGRMSCVRPNFQNIPREGGFRAQIIADAGYLQIGADFSGVELRVAAALSQDQHLIEIILADDAAKRINPKAKSDIHWKIAQAAYGTDATKSQRYNVKRAVFGRLYGSGVEGIKNALGITMREAQMIVEILDSMTPGLTVWSRRLEGMVKSGYTDFPTHSGRIIHLRSPHSAPNYAIQGTAREIIVDSLIKWSETQWGRCVLWPVHDEVDVMVPAAEAVDATAALVDCMETTFMGVPIIATAEKPSAYWCDSA
jgi:hypothetical protein